MSDVLNSQQPAINEPLGNSPEARNPDGSIKDTQTEPNLSPTEQLTDEQKAAAAKAEADKTAAGKKDGEKSEGAPEKYEPFKAPEGKELSPELVTAAEATFKELNLTQEQGQKLVDLWNAQTAGISERLDQMIADQRNEWRGQIAKDKTLGNGTDNLSPAAKQNIDAVIQACGDEAAQTALKAALDLTGAGDNPAIVAAFNKVGALLREGSVVKGGGPSKPSQTPPGQGQRSAAQTMFPNLPSANG